MAGLDFKRGTDLFIGTEQELAQALGIAPDDLGEYRKNPQRVPGDLIARLGKVLTERGRGMMRVGEMMLEGE